MVEGTILILLGIFTVLQALYFSVEDRDQRECFESKFNELSRVVQIRGGLAERETSATSGVLDVYAEAAGLVKDDPTKPLKPEDQEQLQRDLVKALLRYQDEINAVQKVRDENQIPPYPVGICSEE
jgi:hypothetical protein